MRKIKEDLKMTKKCQECGEQKILKYLTESGKYVCEFCGTRCRAICNSGRQCLQRKRFGDLCVAHWKQDKTKRVEE